MIENPEDLEVLGLRVVWTDLEEGLNALSLPAPTPTVYLSHRLRVLPRWYRRFVFTHEFAHFATNTFYRADTHWADRLWYEGKAQRWTLRALVPDHVVSQTLASGLTEPWQWAEVWGLPVELCIFRVRLFGQKMCRGSCSTY